LGAALAAGFAVGVITPEKAQALFTTGSRSVKPTIEETERSQRLKFWKKAIEKSLCWVEE